MKEEVKVKEEGEKEGEDEEEEEEEDEGNWWEGVVPPQNFSHLTLPLSTRSLLSSSSCPHFSSSINSYLYATPCFFSIKDGAQQKLKILFCSFKNI